MENAQANQVQEETQQDIQVNIQQQPETEVTDSAEISDTQAQTTKANNDTVTPQEKQDTNTNTNHAIMFVMSGLHKGAGVAIDSETSIGSDIDNDLILTDDGIAKQHLILSPIESKLNYGMQLTCKNSSIVINNEIILGSEETFTIYDSCVVTLGTVHINITIHKASTLAVAYKKYMKPQMRTVETLGTVTKKYLSPSVIFSDIRNIILMMVAILVLVGSVVFIMSMKKTKATVDTRYAAMKQIKTVRIKENVNRAELHQAAKKDLEQILQQYDLKSRLDLTINKDIIYVNGNINQYELQNWSKVLNWFDTAYGTSKINLVPLITVNNGLRRTISFKAIVANGSVPYVVSWTGDRFKPGATLPGGWIILKISDEGVVVKDSVDERIFLVNHIRSQHGEAVPDFQ